MIGSGGQDRNGKVEEYLQLMRSLACELEQAMGAIAHNSLSDLEESIANQQELSARLTALTHDLNSPRQSTSSTFRSRLDDDLMKQVRAASATLQVLNCQYAALIKLSAHSVGMMVSLFNTYRGNLQEGCGTGLKHQTWSCHV